MSSSDDRQAPHETVLVRRRGGDHGDGHHGGAWKIAFADFMTAMMCFFLVMWLINATDKKTVTQIATYFNPLRLNDRLPSTKGLHDPSPHDAKPEHKVDKESRKDDAGKSAPSTPSHDIENKTDKKEKKEKGSKSAKSAGHAADSSRPSPSAAMADQDILRDPYSVLDQIAAEEDGPEHVKQLVSFSAHGLPLDHLDPAAKRRRRPDAAEQTMAPASSSQSPSGGSAGKSVETLAKPGSSARPAGHSDDKSSAAREIKEQLSQALSDFPPGRRPHIGVEDLKLEILVSITDDFDFGMFAVSSARPTRNLVVVMERVAQVLARTSGRITIRGHTDGRPFRTAENDNWRLSMSRAQVALYMLTRGGLPQDRIKQLQGHADHSLAVPSDPLAARNRRIEILIEKDGL